jgi:hypothetical protein
MIKNNQLEYNYYESEYCKLKIYKNDYNDIFYIYIEENKIYIQRIDKKTGWGQILKLVLFHKIIQKEEIIEVGSSEENIKIISFNENINSSLSKQPIHYENNKYKLFYISYVYNDVFSVDYNENNKIITVKRIDTNTGWDQDLNLKYIDIYDKIKIINIGKSKTNVISINIDIDLIPYKIIYNYYESNNYIINLHENEYMDLFFINFYEDNNTIYIKRMDSNTGWGQILKLNILDINQNHNFIIYIGNSLSNEIYKKIDLTIRKCYVSLTTIPSRIKLDIFKENINDFIKNQTYPIEKIFIVIANKYKRFQEKIPNNIIEDLKKNLKVSIIVLDEDLGPASKYLGPLIKYNGDSSILKDNLLIIIDDDRKYNKNLIRNFVIGYNSFPNIKFSSGLWDEYFNKNYKDMNENFLEFKLYKEDNNNKFYFGQGLGGFFGFCIKIENIKKFINYNYFILNKIPKAIYHDEGIILGYLKYNKENILYLKHMGCNIVEEELVDALCKSNLVDRGQIEKEILKITNLEKF